MTDTRVVQDETINPIQRVGIGPGGDDAVTVDSTVHALVGINVPHHEVHEGESFTSGHLIESVADDASINILIQVGAKDAHFTFNVTAEGMAWALLFENTTTSNVGTALTENNRNRVSTNVATTVITHTPTITADGTQIMPTQILPGGTTGSSAGTNRESGLEWILKHGLVYMFRLTNKAGSAKDLQSNVDWYEEEMA